MSDTDSGLDDGEHLDTDLGSFSLDDEDQLQAEDTLVDRGVDDVLDEGYSPADRPRGSLAWGTTAWEQAHHETIEQRILQEEPDPNTAYGAPDNESGLDDVEDDRVGGDDPDAIPVEDDFLGDTGMRTGRLVAPDEGAHEDVDKDAVADDVGRSAGAASAEEAAMHIVRDVDLAVDDDLAADEIAADDDR